MNNKVLQQFLLKEEFKKQKDDNLQYFGRYLEKEYRFVSISYINSYDHFYNYFNANIFFDNISTISNQAVIACKPMWVSMLNTKGVSLGFGYDFYYLLQTGEVYESKNYSNGLNENSVIEIINFFENEFLPFFNRYNDMRHFCHFFNNNELLTKFGVNLYFLLIIAKLHNVHA